MLQKKKNILDESVVLFLWFATDFSCNIIAMVVFADVYTMRYLYIVLV